MTISLYYDPRRKLPGRLEFLAIDAAQRTLRAYQMLNEEMVSEEQKKQIKKIARYHNLLLDLELKRAALDLTVPFTRNDQALAAAALSSAFREIVRLQAELGYERMDRPPDITKADTRRMAWYRAHRNDPK